MPTRSDVRHQPAGRSLRRRAAGRSAKSSSAARSHPRRGRRRRHLAPSRRPDHHHVAGDDRVWPAAGPRSHQVRFNMSSERSAASSSTRWRFRCWRAATFDARDDADAPHAGGREREPRARGVSGNAARQVIGQRMCCVGGSREIIGVVGDVAVDVTAHRPLAVYSPHRQFARQPQLGADARRCRQRPAESILPDVRAVVAAIDPELVVHRAAPMTEVVGRGTSRERFALSCGRLCGRVADACGLRPLRRGRLRVRQRTREIGIRIALGATAGRIRRTVFRAGGLCSAPASGRHRRRAAAVDR